MLKFTFEKLIRDKILQKHIDAGHGISYISLKGTDLKIALRAKLHEEADEIPIRDVSDDEIIEEIADVQQVLDDLKAQYSVTDEDIEKARIKKFEKKGGFENGVYINFVEVDENDEWVSYYRQSPEKYPEIIADQDIIVPTIEPGAYMHYKNKKYEVIGVALHSETQMPLVVYKPLYESMSEYWVRPYDMFVENVEVDGKIVPRFKKMDDSI